MTTDMYFPPIIIKYNPNIHLIKIAPVKNCPCICLTNYIFIRKMCFTIPDTIFQRNHASSVK